MMGWFTTVLAQQGYIVIAVDHPGNNGMDKLTVAGATLFWDRPGDLQAALDTVAADPLISPHLDVKRLGVAGFSAGGFTALAAGGAHVDLPRFMAFCKDHPDDGVCKPQLELAITQEQAMAALSSPELAGEAAHANDDHSIRGVRAVFAMAPAIVQAFDPASLNAMTTPVSIVLGEADQVAPPHTNGGVAARAIPRAQLKALPGVGHYDFLATCSQQARARIPLCRTEVPQQMTHYAAIEAALILFGRNLGGGPGGRPLGRVLGCGGASSLLGPAMSHNTFGHLFRARRPGAKATGLLGRVVDGRPPGIKLIEVDVQQWHGKVPPLARASS